MTAALVRNTDPSASVRTTVADALETLREARPVLVTGGSEGASIVLAAALADTAHTAWTVRRSSGFLTVSLEASRADELALPPVPCSAPDRPAHAVAVDAAVGITTGISAADRARTARVLASSASTVEDLRRPGHVVPIIVAAGGVFDRAQAPEAAVDLCRLAGLPPVAVVAALEPATPRAVAVTPDEVRSLAVEHDLPVVPIQDIVAYRIRGGHGPPVRVTRGPIVTLPTDHGPLTAIGYRDELSGAEHLALCGNPAAPVTVHRECGAAVFRARSCGCMRRLDADIGAVARGERTIIYLRRTGSWADVADGTCDRPLETIETSTGAAIAASLPDRERDHGPAQQTASGDQIGARLRHAAVDQRGAPQKIDCCGSVH